LKTTSATRVPAGRRTPTPRRSPRRATRTVARAGEGETDGNVKFANNKEEFEAVSAEAGSGLVAVQISTKTCGPCKMIYPTFVGLSEELPEVTFVKIMGDTDLESRALMKEWGVRVVPLFLLFRNGERIGEWSGAKADILKENVRAACNDDEK
jgi:thioredoxin 1